MKATSASLGTLLSVSGASVSKHAAISGKAAFLAPLIGISPLRRAPPLILILSMTPRLARTPERSVLARASRQQQR
jgi:hypothetical protein